MLHRASEDPLIVAFGFSVAGLVVLLASLVVLSIERARERREARHYDRMREQR